MTQRILLAGLINETNLGDRVIFDCTYNLLKKNSNIEFDFFDLDSRMSFLERVIRKIFKITRGKKASDLITVNHFYWKSLKKVKKSDKIVFVGGGLIKWRYQSFWAQISGVIKAAERFKKSVFFNAVGVEGYSEKNDRCLVLKKYLNSDVVKLITTRDDLDLLQSKYIHNNKIKVYRCADPAVFASDIYSIKKKKSDIIGIGLVRKNIFIDNAINFTPKQVSEFYVDLINLLQRKGKKIKLFINGNNADLQLANEISQFCRIDKKDIAVPSTPEELVNLISQFKVVIAGRLHACIVSYSLEIPAIGFVWNEKLRFWGNNINHSERFLEVNELNAAEVERRLIEILGDSSYDENHRYIFRNTQLKSIDDIIRT